MPLMKLRIKKLESDEGEVEDCVSTRNSDIQKKEIKSENKYTYNTNINYTKPNYFSVQIKKRTPS